MILIRKKIWTHIPMTIHGLINIMNRVFFTPAPDLARARALGVDDGHFA